MTPPPPPAAPTDAAPPRLDAPPHALAWLPALFGAALLISPLIRIFAQDARVLGAPLIVVFVFGVWAALIAAAALAARRAPQDAGERAAPPRPPEPRVGA